MGDNDFKHVIGDYSKTHIGVRFSFAELLMNDRVPFKFQSIIMMYILKDNTPETMLLGDHIIAVSPDSNSYRIYSSLKMTVTFCEPVKKGFKMRTLRFDKFRDYYAKNWTDSHSLQEITLSNLALMTFIV